MSVTTTCRDISALTETAQIACNLFMEKCKAEGLNVLITETYRSQERQDYLYAQGRTRSGNKVTWTKNSRHTSCRAWDICKNVKGAEYSDASFFKKCGAIAKELGITWGGTWKTPDTPHFEVDEDWVAPSAPAKAETPVTVNDIVWELAHRGIITDKELWLKKLEEDKNSYWLAKKVIDYIGM